MNSALLASGAEVIAQYAGIPVTIQQTAILGGGSINRAYRVQTSAGDYFMKHNRASLYPMMFKREAQGLQLIAASKTINTPSVIGTGNASGEDFLILEFLDRGKMHPAFWNTFGKELAAMHSVTQEYFGLDHDNYMGSLQQNNSFRMEYDEFFIENRLEPQLKIAGSELQHLRKNFDDLFNKLRDIIPVERPSLVHGDLWSGNFLTGPDGKAWLIDPAAHFGHREADIAMTKLFGGFEREFYDAYNDAKPLEKGWEQRMDIYNLYPLLVHVNLFGGGYVQQVTAIVRRFS